MKDIKCPKCGTSIPLTEEDYATLLSQIRNEEFEKELSKREKDIKEKSDLNIQIAQDKAKQASDKEIAELKAKIQEQEASLSKAQLEQEMAVKTALQEKEKDLINKNNEIKALNEKIVATRKDAIESTQHAVDKEIADLKAKISEKESDLKNAKLASDLAISNALSNKDKELAEKNNEISKLSSRLTEAEKDSQISEQKLKESYEAQLKLKDEDIERWKNYRMGDSTKDLGESLEQYCHDMFEEVRADAYPNAYFEKDNESVKDEDETKGSKGDFVFRDFSSDGIELVSILFDMKTEKDNTATKKTNASHLAKLDADRNKKGCEYAVLVSTLEADSNLYNRGIVDVSHKFPKTFVIRPQFFLAIIGLIRNMALKSYEYKKQVVVYQNEHMDITNFEAAVKAITDKINADYEKAGAIYDEVDNMCTAMIKKISDFRDKFKTAQKHIGAAQNQLDNLTIRRLTKNNPTMKEKFDNIDK